MYYSVKVATEEIYIVEADNEDIAQNMAAERMFEEHNASECYFIGMPEDVTEEFTQFLESEANMHEDN